MKNGMLIRSNRLLGVEVTSKCSNIVCSGEEFTRTWNIINLGCHEWKNLSIYHKDESHNGLYPYLRVGQRSMALKDTKVGEVLEIAVSFKAPSYPCSVSSKWMIEGEFCGVTKVLDTINLTVDVLSHPLEEA